MSAFITEAQVRSYLDVTGITGAYSDELLGSNIRAASAFLERNTFRQFTYQPNTTKTFTTNGEATVAIPDLASVTSVVMQGATLVADSSYWLIPDNHGVYTTIQVRPYGNLAYSSYKANPEWFDRNLDHYAERYGPYFSLPNDLVITGNWGYSPMPDDLLHATKVLAAWYTRRPASVLANSQITPDGNQLNFSGLPPEVNEFLSSWTLTRELAAI